MTFNYLKTYRKNLGLSQRELGYLIGYQNNVRICHLEKGRSDPSFRESIIFELLFEKPSSRIFRNLYFEAALEFADRLAPLEQHFAEVEQTEAAIDTQRHLRRIQQYVVALNTHDNNE